jgi:hypothetical protein
MLHMRFLVSQSRDGCMIGAVLEPKRRFRLKSFPAIRRRYSFVSGRRWRALVVFSRIIDRLFSCSGNI